ncbi:PAS domain S-box protein [Mucilaginibacter psychrotolerans]|uniref:histidine kinase n=1 Tax=Mucilaginibacter psychrotolerans TaxID=1524096 RepID=A0A4Y8S818_9SPHI|nr:PAS domain S-box protein [Mucilaginibacter psychrotolerans]TFF34740.1 PAS domain S-box protein [Mucilaginibacter psychrotolerans]
MAMLDTFDPIDHNLAVPNILVDNKLFQKLIENSYSGITLFDKNLNIIYRSPSAERISGWKREDLSSQSLNDLTHPEDLKIVNQTFDKVMGNPGLPVNATFRTKHAGGHFIWIEAIFTNLLQDADVNGIVCNFKDISAQKNVELALEQSIHELSDYKYALDESAIVAITDHKGIIKHVNNNFCNISRYSREELIGQDHRIINSSYHEKAFIKNIWTTIANGNIWKGELKNKAKDDSYYWVDTTIVPFLNEEGKPYQYVAIRSDITERKDKQKKIVENSRFIKTITDNLPAMMAYWTADLHCSFANKPLLDWFEMQSEQMHGISKQALFGPLEFSSYEPFINEVLKGFPQSFERTFVKEGGKTIYTYTQYLPDRQGNLVKGFYSLIHDITEVKLAERALKKQTEKVEQATSLARIGSWEIDLRKQTVSWSAITKEILHVDSDFEPTLELGISLYKEGKSRDTVLEVIKNAMEHGTPWDEELEVQSPAGITKWIRVIGDAEFVGGVCVRLYGSCQDVNIRKMAELQNQETLIEKNTILESIADAFFAVDKNWVVTYWNRIAEEILGKSRNEMLNSNLWEVFSDSVHSESYKNYMRAMMSQEAVHFEDYYPPLQKWYEISAYPSARGLSVYFKDITERKIHNIELLELNESLRMKAKELAISNAELEQFAYVASHDLQEPLRMVTSFLTQLERKYNDIIDDKGRQYIHFAVDGAKRMRQIILDLLEFSRVGKIEDKLQEVNINVIIEDILALYRKQIQDKRAKIECKDLPVLKAYKTSLRQVFQNLISNSLKYSNAAVHPEIKIKCVDHDSYWEFSVTDNGIGIDAEYFEKIFIIFQRLHNKNEYSGTGMGLAVTKKIVESMGGKIWVESAEGKGSTFYFTILKNL